MRTLLQALLLLITTPLVALAATITIHPVTPLQGEAILVQIDVPMNTIASLTRDGVTLPYFSYGTSTGALIGIDIHAKVGTSTLRTVLTTGETIETSFAVAKRQQPIETFTVPTKLGGNSAHNQKKVVSTLAKENSQLANLITSTTTLWSEPFIAPVANPVITDVYGYIRDSGAATITHKGADFHADIGTPVLAMNRGVVRLSKKFTVYGNTVIIDHGNGVMTLYMHLSKRLLKEGALVERSETIGLSGMTGYAEHPHLHLSIRIDGHSIDPVEFLKLFGITLPNK